MQPGPLYAKLARGESVTVNGRVITPDMVLGRARRGRKVVYTGDTRPCERVVEISRNADLLIHVHIADWLSKSIVDSPPVVAGAIIGTIIDEASHIAGAALGALLGAILTTRLR